jgi:ribosomal protein S8
MKVINNHFKKLCRIDCDCCGEDHYILITKDKHDNDLYFESFEAKFSFFTHLKHWIKMCFHWKEFTNGNEKDFFQVLMTRKSVKKLLKILEKEGYTASVNYKQKIKPSNEYSTVFEQEGILITIPNWDKKLLTLSIYPTSKINKWKYAAGKAFSSLTSKQVSEMIITLQCLGKEQ